MRICITYPPLKSKKGKALLSQNRQFQWSKSPTIAFPVIPASAATLLKQNGHQVLWLDCQAENLNQTQWLQQLKNFQPDLVFIETKTPVIKQHWQAIKIIKKALPKTKVALGGDHVTALPQESKKNSPVDYIIKGGHYDRSAAEIAQASGMQSPVPKKFNLDTLPIIDRKLTKWHLYSKNNGNFKKTPATYTMFGRDCWWRKAGGCTFCITGNTQITTKSGQVTIRKIVDHQKPHLVLTHTGSYKKIINWHKRKINQPLITITSRYLPSTLNLTAKHKLYALPKKNLTHCHKKSAWTYLCKPDRVSKFLDCKQCGKKHHHQYKSQLIPAKELKVGDYLCLPINRDIKKIKSINVRNVLKKKSPNQHLDTSNLNIKFKQGLHKIPPTIPISQDFLYLVGLYLAEGHVSFLKSRPNSAYIGWTFSKNEKTYINRTKSIFKQLFNLQLSQTINQANNTCQLYLGVTILAQVFKTLFGHNCYQKKIPKSFLTLPLNQQRSLIEGVFHGDGHLRKRSSDGGKEYILETTSKKLAEQVFSILLRFNTLPSYKIIKPKGKNISTQYKITLFKQDINKVFPKINFNDGKPTHKKGFIVRNYAYIPITKLIKNNFKGHVYNLTVEQDHSYVANLLAVKNCSWTTLFPQFSLRSVDNCLKEVEQLINLGVKEIFDDTGTFPAGKWLTDFCKGMIKKGYNKKIKIGCNLRFGVLQKKDYQLMQKAGFRFLLFGLESANQKTLDKLNKGIKVNQVEKELQLIKQLSTPGVESKLEPHITCMIGYPWETKKQAQNTINLVKNFFKKGLLSSLQATIVIPYPGTLIFKQAQKNNWLKTKNWNHYDMSQPVLKSPLSNQETHQLIRSLYTTALTPRFILKTLKNVLQNPRQLPFYLKSTTQYLARLLDFN
jgi:radical SAM superfamily enzyme YgiQ (UPF0313 family)